MSKTIRYTLLSIREMITSAGPFVLLTLGLLALAYWWLDPTPPKHVTLATGPAQSAYDEFGKRYAQSLAAYGIEVKLLPSEGSAQNLEWLATGKVDLGFVQDGTSTLPDTAEDALVSLGSLFVEPVWLFYREAAAPKAKNGTDRPLETLPQLKGLRVNVGTVGSGVPALMEKLFDANRMDTKRLKLSYLEQTPATVGFLNGQLDALVFVSAPESPMVRMLLQSPGVKLMNFAQSEAYSRRLPFLRPVTLPRGVVNLASNVPAHDVRLIAPTTTLMAREAVHPAVLQLFSQASLAFHGPAGWFNRAREFPNVGATEFPLSDEAERTLRSGVPLMQRYLPFSYANLMERMWLALGIIVAVLLPLSRIVPPLYEFRIRSRVFRWYGQLRDIEERASDGDATLSDLLDELNQLESRAGKITVPLSYTDELYALRNHIELVRKKLTRQQPHALNPTAP
jgi:TRAP-type uncharacterized transport system substrate-binding protein